MACIPVYISYERHTRAAGKNSPRHIIRSHLNPWSERVLQRELVQSGRVPASPELGVPVATLEEPGPEKKGVEVGKS